MSGSTGKYTSQRLAENIIDFLVSYALTFVVTCGRPLISQQPLLTVLDMSRIEVHTSPENPPL